MADSPTPPNEARLRASLAAGCEQAFAELYQRYGPRLFRTALRLVGNRQDAEDCVQEVFAALVRSRRQLVQVHDLAAYQFAALRRHAMRIVNNRQRQPKHLAGDAAACETPPADPRSDKLARALQSLPAEQRETIALKIEAELTFAQIGRVLSISSNRPPAAIATRLRGCATA